MKTSIWGPSAWTFLHAISFAYPESLPSPEHKQAVLNLFASLKYLLPCGDCCAHYCSSYDSESLKNSLDSRDSFSKWLVNFHNAVNVRLKKPIYEYDQSKQLFLGENALCEVQVKSTCAEEPRDPPKPIVWKTYLSLLVISLLVIGIVWAIQTKI
jgi:hypothetical protein